MKPMPPRIWMASSATVHAASEANTCKHKRLSFKTEVTVT
jgi:hypothetical protein